MIRSLTLENFRRHEKTSLEFSPDSQVVAITGRNGAGKSTILEAISFALYGETRHGRRGIAGLVRRGAEHEGMGVVAEFTVGGLLYRVERRWEKGKHSAALYANNTLHTQTADGVTGAITGLLGMDAVGFRLATVAKQKELDGLADMTPAIRKKTIARLLRLDAVAAAALSARDLHKNEKAAAFTLSGAANITEKAESLADAQAVAAEASAAHAAAQQIVRDLDARIGASSGVDDAYRTAQIAAGRAEAARDAAAAEHGRARTAVASHQVPAEVPGPDIDLADIVAELDRVNDLIHRGRAQDALVKQLDASTRRAAETASRLDEIRTQREKLSAGVDDTSLPAAAARVADLTASLAGARTVLDSSLTAVATAEAAVAAVAVRRKTLDEVGPVCTTCGQDVDEDHRERTEQELAADTETTRQALVDAGEALAAARERVAGLEQDLTVARTEHTELAAACAEVAALDTRISEGERALHVYEGEISRLTDQVDHIDLDAAYGAKTRAEAAKTQAENAAHAALVRAAALEKAADLEAALAAAATRLEDAETALAAAAAPADLVEAFNQRQQLISEREAEREFCEALAADAAGAQATVEGARAALEDASKVAAKVNEHRSRAEVAAKTATLLNAVSQRLATQVRPQLEGAVSALLQQMSDGRFSGVQVSDDYEITVCDHDGKYYPVSEFSGGEADLIALALRLALAQVVAARHGGGGAGFLILDEVFGSQDETRRYAILEALRRLRATYGQILLISHVGGIEDAADMVLEVARDDDEELARVAVVAG